MHAPIHFQETRRARRVLLVGLGTLLMVACADELPLEPDAKSIPPKAAIPRVATLAAPANDDFENAAVIGTLPYSDTISTIAPRAFRSTAENFAIRARLMLLLRAWSVTRAWARRESAHELG